MAADDLFNARKIFIDSVTKTVIKQLLDNLLEDKVLNDEETDSVTEENSARAEQARCLIDMVRKKGVKASEKMIARVQERDPGLHDKCGLAPRQLAQMTPSSPQLSQQEEHPVSSVLIPSTKDFKEDILQRKRHEVYVPMDKSGRKRLALLINNVEFDVKNMLRLGAVKDEENMERLLSDLGYDVVKHRNLSGQEMDEAVKAFSKREEHLLSDSVFVVMMSHGELGGIMGVHYKEGDPKPDVFPINNIFIHLNTENCKALINKPKVILIQACRGGKNGSVWVSDAVPGPSPDLGLESDSTRREHIEKDFISLLSCTPDTVSYRNQKMGSLFVQHIMETFNTYAHNDQIEELFRKVMGRFEDFPRQMPTKDRATLTKHFYLFPGL
ncbi:caspase a-like isoform X2 [Coregonus clupeaformis]|uniref:caspase a-like isoform X2 n=1 Tax=Coregonus clupeaformis TaxID=59861 RepID=UPI001E1C93ED|nr:caspase a-like isoform X2 [Coregonus clupeaformis]